jgi:succinate dehydrogenase/fumarate reductase flavoprotein subunit
MSNVIVKMKGHYGANSPGDTCGFPAAVAGRLIKDGMAVLVKGKAEVPVEPDSADEEEPSQKPSGWLGDEGDSELTETTEDAKEPASLPASWLKKNPPPRRRT